MNNAPIIIFAELLIIGESSVVILRWRYNGVLLGVSSELYRPGTIFALNINRRLLLKSKRAHGLSGSCSKLPSLGPFRSPARRVRGVLGFERWTISSSSSLSISQGFGWLSSTELVGRCFTGTSSSSVVSPQSADLVSDVKNMHHNVPTFITTLIAL